MSEQKKFEKCTMGTQIDAIEGLPVKSLTLKLILFWKLFLLKYINRKERIQMEKENEALKSEVGDMRNELEEMRGLKKELLGIINKVSEGSWYWYKS